MRKIKKIIPKKLFRAFQPAYHFILGWVSAAWYGWPSEKLIVIGVTGTTGKTTCVYLISKVLEGAGYKVGYTSTAMFSDGKKEWLNDKKMTMVGRFFTQRILRDMVNSGCQYAIVETTSEGIVQFRHRFINYDILLFTGLYPEHIESHGSFENYKEAKGRLFTHLKNCKTKYCDDKKKVEKRLSSLKKINLNRVKKAIIVNGDDEHAGYFLKFWAEEKLVFSAKPKITPGFSIKDAVIIKGEKISASSGGLSLEIDKEKISLNLLGEFNAVNALGAYSTGVSQNIRPDTIRTGLEKVSGIPGRLEKIDEGQKFTCIVDYAFEPKAILKCYELIEMLPHNKLIHVLGSAGGGRDVARRPKLGEIAGRNADIVIATNEDPYDEDPNVIIDQVALGAQKVGKKMNVDLFKVLDRRMGIKKALRLAGEGDIVLISGKGCEQAICAANGEKIPWDDRQVVREELNNLI